MGSTTKVKTITAMLFEMVQIGNNLPPPKTLKIRTPVRNGGGHHTSVIFGWKQNTS